MISPQFHIKKSNRFLPHILLVGLGIATANYIMNSDLNWMQWAIQSISTSLIIGYTLVTIGLNKSWFQFHFKPRWKLYGMLILIFFLIGALATEVEHLIRSLVFQTETYLPLSSGKMYLFNGIISLILGLSFFQSTFFFRTASSMSNQDQIEFKSSQNRTAEIVETKDPILSVPVKKGENILLIPTEDIVYFEAFDNYSFVYDLKGEKKLCDYSLIFLEKRLGKTFSRVHRKYIVNERHIKQIKPHLNGRYLIVFDNAALPPINTSKSYVGTIRRLIKIE